MAEGTTLHNLLQSQLSEGKITKNEAATRSAINSNIKTGIKSESSKNEVVKDYGKNLLKSTANTGKSDIKAARSYDLKTGVK